MAEAFDLCTLADLKAWLSVTGTTEDAKLARLISGVSGWLLQEMQLPQREDGQAPTPFQDTYDDRYDGPGGTTLLLRRRPVTQVLQVSVDAVPIPRATSPVVSGFEYDTLAVYLRGYRFTRGVRNVRVVSVAGYATDHPMAKAIAQLAIDVCSLLWRERDRIGIASKTLGPDSIAYVLKAMPERSWQMVEGLRPRVAV